MTTARLTSLSHASPTLPQPLSSKGLEKAGETVGSAIGGKFDEKVDGAQNAGDEVCGLTDVRGWTVSTA